MHLMLHTLLQAIRDKYTTDAAILGQDSQVIFKEKEVTLDVPKDGANLENGWKITPLNAPVVSLYYATTYSRLLPSTCSFRCFIQIEKEQVDYFKPGTRVPCCSLFVNWTVLEQQPVQLIHTIDLNGAKEPHNWIKLLPPLQG